MSETAHRWFVYFSQVMTSYQENTTKQPIECWILTTDRAKTHRHTDKCRNGVLKHKRVKQSSYRISITTHRNKCILIWRHAWRWFPKNSYTKKITKLLLFSILWRNLSKFITQTGIYCSKQLETTFSSILWKIIAYHL